MSDPRILGPGLLPTPFTAEEIRDASGTGKTIRLLVEGPDGWRVERVNRFSECDEAGALLERWSVSAQGGVDGEVVSGRVEWSDLQAHAAFPAAVTVRSTEVVDLPIGRVECMRYDVRDDDSADAAVETFWFAPDCPGMPVRYEVPTPAGMLRTTVLSVEVDGEVDAPPPAA